MGCKIMCLCESLRQIFNLGSIIDLICQLEILFLGILINFRHIKLSSTVHDMFNYR